MRTYGAHMQGLLTVWRDKIKQFSYPEVFVDSKYSINIATEKIL